MRVLLVSPRYRTHVVAPHLGLGYLASALRRDGHEVGVLDGLREPVTYDPSRWDLVGLTAMTTYFPEAVLEVARAKAAGLPTIVGGPHVIADPLGSLRQSGADYACAGEGELLLQAFAAGRDPRTIEGLCRWEDGRWRTRRRRSTTRSTTSAVRRGRSSSRGPTRRRRTA